MKHFLCGGARIVREWTRPSGSCRRSNTMITMRREHRVTTVEEAGIGRLADDVTASEIAAFVYCAKAWHLERVVGALPSAAADRARTAGTTHHVRHGARVRLGSWLGRNERRAIAALLLLALILAALSLVIG